MADTEPTGCFAKPGTREASRDLEGILLKRVCDQLRARVPEIVEDAVREYLGTEL